MRDWPLKLRLNAGAIRLGTALYYARAEVYHPVGEQQGRCWDSLALTEKREWIERAEDILHELKPKPIVEIVGITHWPDIPVTHKSLSVTIQSVGTFDTRDHEHGSVCLLTLSDGRQMVSETPGLYLKASTLKRFHVGVHVSERFNQPNVLDRLEAL